VVLGWLLRSRLDAEYDALCEAQGRELDPQKRAEQEEA